MGNAMAQVLKEEIRENILKAALQEFFNKGYQSAAMRSVAEQAKIATGLIYSYYKKIQVDNFRLIENGSGFNAAFDMVYPAGLQKREEEIRNAVAEKVSSKIPNAISPSKVLYGVNV